MSSVNARPALLLNADFRPVSMVPLSVVGWQDAVRNVVGGKYIAVEESDTVIRSAGSREHGPITMRVPSVVALREYLRLDRAVAFTRLGIYVRDRFRCAYCGQRFPASQLTFDHVVPRAKGGRTRWTNIVAADAACNARKGSKTLEESGMRLLQKPYVPTRRELNDIAREFPPPIERLDRSWLAYLGIDPARAAAATRVTGGAASELVFPASMTDEDYWTVELEE